MDLDNSSDSDASGTSTENETYEDEGSFQARSRSATPTSTADPEDSATLDEPSRLPESDDERIISSEEEEDGSATLTNREVEVTSGQSQARRSAIISITASSSSCSGPPSQSLLQDPDDELAESVKEALGLLGENRFTSLDQDEASDIGERVRKILTCATDGALVPLLHHVLTASEVKKLSALKGIPPEEGPPCLPDVRIKREEPSDSQGTDDVDQRMRELEAIANVTAIENLKKERDIKEEPMLNSSQDTVSKSAAIDADKIINISSDEESEANEQVQKMRQAIDNAEKVSESSRASANDDFDSVIIQEIKDGAHDALIDGIVSGKKRSKRHNYFVKVINDGKRDVNILLNQVSSNLVRLCSPDFLGVKHVGEFNKATREKLNERIEKLVVRPRAKENTDVVEYYLTFCLQPELLINIVLKRWRMRKKKKTYRSAELHYLGEECHAVKSKYKNQGSSDSDSELNEDEVALQDELDDNSRDSESVPAKKVRADNEPQPSTSRTSSVSRQLPSTAIVRRLDRVERRAHTVQSTLF